MVAEDSDHAYKVGMMLKPVIWQYGTSLQIKSPFMW